MRITEGTYVIPNSSTAILVRKVRYHNDEYVKAWIEIIHRKYKYTYQTIRNQKLFLKNIDHWQKLKSYE